LLLLLVGGSPGLLLQQARPVDYFAVHHGFSIAEVAVVRQERGTSSLKKCSGRRCRRSQRDCVRAGLQQRYQAHGQIVVVSPTVQRLGVEQRPALVTTPDSDS
jgi:hypothetical protein